MVDNRLALAIQTRRIEDCTSDEMLNRVSTILRQTYAIAGFKSPEPTDLAVFTAKLAADLCENFPYLTLEEVSFCFEMGAKEEYGEIMGINLRTITKWLKAYKTSDLRYRAKLAVEAEKKALPPVSEAYNLQAENRFLQNSFRRYKESGSMERVMSVRVYQTLQERGIIRNTREEKYHAISLFERWKPASGAWMTEEMRQSRIKTLAQEWLLKQYFDSIEELKLAG